jgi:hypothetical protein
LLQPPVLTGFLSAETSLTATSTVWFPAIRDIWNEWEVGKEMRIYSVGLCGTIRDLLHAVKSYYMGPTALLPI